MVCLPYAHQGGSLRVTHGAQGLTWDWGSDNPDVIKWAAFYSDCEHEIMEVTSGHVRISETIISERCPSIDRIPAFMLIAKKC